MGKCKRAHSNVISFIISAIYCGKLDHVEYGGVKVKYYTVGSKAFFYCNKGYKLYGEPHRVCEYDGQWGGEYPVCKRKYPCIQDEHKDN